MSDHKEKLKSMLQSFINDKQEDAAVQLHDYFIDKSRDVTGIAQPQDDLDLETLEGLEDPEGGLADTK
jgi:hypothetical protein